MKEKEKANDWMWQSHKESQLMIVKRPHTKDKKDVVFVFPTKCFTPTPTPIKSLTVFKYNDYM